MCEDKITPLKNPCSPATITDALMELRRKGAQWMLAGAIKSEVTDFLKYFLDQKTADSRQWVIRNVHLPTQPFQSRCGYHGGVLSPNLKCGTERLVAYFATVVESPNICIADTTIEEISY